ncbi:butyrophilin subfamily 3 member A2-like [Halichoeres trimaculatus]|uniref:butyrophilin subfamily 3 member A2-like n=1 Tax=Halichoeres trimaculatus TaxID=147232 RepID=UPI003D9F3FB5
MCERVFLGAALLTCWTGTSLVQGLPEPVQAFVGGNIILPCSFRVPAHDDLPSVEWSKEGLEPNVVFLYRHGCETYEMKNPDFEFRTSLISTELKNRNFSLRISNVRLSDAGTYRCLMLSGKDPWVYTEVELSVGAVSEPKLSFTSADGGGVTLQCEATCGLPEPEITFLDNEGNYLPADEPRRAQEDSGCFTVSRRLTLQEATTRVTCRVHQPEINQTRTTETLIPADCFSSSLPTTGLAVGGTISVLLNLCGLAVLVWNKFRKSDVYKVPVSRKSSNVGPYENQLLLSVSVDEDPNGSLEKPPGEEADLESKPRDTFQQPETNPNTQQVSFPGKPTGRSTLKPGPRVPRSRLYSDPEVMNPSGVSSSSPKKRVSFDSQFTSSSVTQHGPNTLNLKRRHSSVLPYPTSNRFHPSPELLEETLTFL